MNLKQIKDSKTCLDYLGEPVKKVATGYLYHAPWRTDEHPSLSVTLNGKGWHDLATGEHGNVIDLVMKAEGFTQLSQVCMFFDSSTYMSSSSFRLAKMIAEGKEKIGNRKTTWSNSRKPKEQFSMFEVGKIQSPGLFAYLHSRGISPSIARQLCQEAHYSFTDQESDNYLYALAWPNNKGGYELRSSSYKGCKAPKGITFNFEIDQAPFVVFEGFMDCLSFATLTQGIKHNYLVLNSVSLVDAAITQLHYYPGYKIYLCLDNDEAGDAATAKMLDQLRMAEDIRCRFAPYKDINDYLVNHG